MTESGRTWREIVARYQTPSIKPAVWQLASTLTLLITTCILMYFSLRVSYWLTLLLALPAAGFTIRTFIIMHDCGHGSFLPSRTWNVWSMVTGILTPRRSALAPGARDSPRYFGASRAACTGTPTMTVKEYLKADGCSESVRIYRNRSRCSVRPAFLFIKPAGPPKPSRAGRTANVH